MQFSRLIRLPLVIIALVAAALAFTGPAYASSSKALDLDSGRTVLTVDKGTLEVLTKNKVSVKAVKGASASGRSFSFKIVDGEVDKKTAAGKIEHSGGLKFKQGGDEVGVQDFIIDTKKKVLTAKVSGTSTRIPLLDLDLSDADIDSSSSKIVVSNVKASLTADAAKALNAAFDTSLFKGGLKIGVAKVTARS